MDRQSGQDCGEAATPENTGLRERELKVVLELAWGDDAQVAFQGIRRRLEIHQEALRRALRNLRRSGYVDKRKRGYGLTEAGRALLEGRCVPQVCLKANPVASLLLPAGYSNDDVVACLSRRWFDGLRWYGVTGGPGEHSLMWQFEDRDGFVRVRVRGGQASVEVQGVKADDEALAASAVLIGALADSLRTPRVAKAPAVLHESYRQRFAA